MPMLNANVECQAAFGCPWGCIWLLRGSIWLPMGLHMVAQRLHLAAERLHFGAQGPSMAAMRQLCSICCVWLGQAGVQDGREHGQLRVVGLSGGPNSRQQTAMKTAKCIEGSRLRTVKCIQDCRLMTAKGLQTENCHLCLAAWHPKGAGGFL